MRVENHGQGFSAALGMPEYTALSICAGGNFRFFHGLSDREIPMITGEDLDRLFYLIGETDEVLEDIQ